MQSLFKSRKKRDSHAKSPEETPASAEFHQRTPSGTSVKSGSSPLKSNPGAYASAKASQIGSNVMGILNGPSSDAAGSLASSSGTITNGASTAASNVSQTAQNQLQGMQNSANTLNSPFLGPNQQNRATPGNNPHPEQVSGGPGMPGQPRQPQPGTMHGQLYPGQGYDANSRFVPKQYPSTENMRAGGQPQPQQQQHIDHHSPQMHGSPRHRSPASSPGTPSQTRMFRGQSPGTPTSPRHQSDTPWAEFNIQRAAPSPRFGHSANYIAARDGELFIMGGIRDMDILNDLWVIDTNTLTGYELPINGFKVGPRVGHASLVLGNAHVVFGGDTKIEESDPLDDNLYLLNTSSLKWTVAQPQGPRPTGRYGHSLSNIGARVYVFGGQVDEEFYDDMWSFDLTNWRSPTARWERIQPATPPPPPRTNHTVVTYQDKLYLFGGANGDLWYSDTWRFDPTTRVWEQLECTGYVPAPCQGHATTIIDDVMYVFGGMSSQGVLIDQLFALKLTTLKWYTFQNLGPGPSPRSGHSLTAFGGDKILVWGGTDQGNSAYVLDVSRINYPDDGPSGVGSIQPNSPSLGSSHLAAGTQAGEELSGKDAVVANKSPVVDQLGSPKRGDNDREVSADAGNTSSGPTTLKEVRELQPHVYAPQSSETSGPTQARSSNAARNSMLFSKRRSVLLPASPVKDLKYGKSDHEDLRERDIDTEASEREREHQFNDQTISQPSLPTQDSSAQEPFAAISGNETAGAEGISSNSTDRQSQVKSYVTETEGDSPDERFVSAVDLHDSRKGLEGSDSSRGARNHTRGLSFGVSAAQPSLPDVEEISPVTENGQTQFQKLEKELGGMPGGFAKQDSAASLPGAAPTASVDSLRSVGLARSEEDPDNQENVDDDSLSGGAPSSAPGIRRSQLQTNLALQNKEAKLGDDDLELSQSHKEASTLPPTSNVDETDREIPDVMKAVTPSIPMDTEKNGVSTNKAFQESLNNTATNGDTDLGSVASVSAELAQLRKEVDRYRQRDLGQEFHDLKSTHASLQRELADLKDQNGQLTRKHASITGHNSDLKQRYDQLEKVMDEHMDTLKAQQAALNEANSKIQQQQAELAELATLRSENADLKMKLKTAESAQKHAEEQLAAVNNSYASLKSAHSDLSAKHLATTTGSKEANAANDTQGELHTHFSHLISLWDNFKHHGHPDSASRDIDNDGENGGGGFKELYENQKKAAEQAHSQLEAAYTEQVNLKRQLRELSAAHSDSPSKADVDLLKQQHNSAFSSLSSKYHASQEEIQKQASALEDLRQRLQKLEASHTELQNEYNKAVDLSRNQQVALTKTREELNMSRAHAQRLEEQLEDASLQNSSFQADRSIPGPDGDVSHNSVSSSRNDQAAMVIRDLRAQVVILEEEMQNQRDQIMRLKKAALTK